MQPASATAILKRKALAERFEDRVAEKTDLQELERLDRRIAELAVRFELRIADMESRLKLWMAGQVFVIVGVLGTLGYFR